MINRVTGEVAFQDGLFIKPHNAIELPHRTRKLSLKTWTRHILGVHTSEHGEFEVEALSVGMENIQLVLLAHRHTFYKSDTPEDAARLQPNLSNGGAISARLQNGLGTRRHHIWARPARFPIGIHKCVAGVAQFKL